MHVVMHDNKAVHVLRQWFSLRTHGFCSLMQNDDLPQEDTLILMTSAVLVDK